jgi:hypothetical protein
MRIATPTRPVIDGKMECRYCHEFEPLSEFYLHNRKQNDVWYYDSYCKYCVGVKSARNKKRNRQYRNYLQRQMTAD